MRTRGLIRTAFIFLVTMTTLTPKSTADIGRWIQLNDGTTMDSVRVLDAWGNRLYAGTDNGIFISRDHGGTWGATSFVGECTTIIVNWNTVYAGTWSEGVFRSDDAGRSWKPIRDGLRTYDSGAYGEVRRILITRGEIINVMYHRGTYTSADRGETWHDVSQEWPRGDSLLSVMEFDGYLWSSASLRDMFRSPDGGQTWEPLPDFEPDRANDWAALNNQLYVAGERGIGRWNEKTQAWEYLMEGLPTGSPWDPDDPPYIPTLAIHHGRLFSGLDHHGVYALDTRAESWYPVGLNGHSVYTLLSYNSALYAGTENGLYQARIPRLQPHGKTGTTWGRVKQNTYAKD